MRDEAGLATGATTPRHRMLRHGIPFGPPPPPDATADDGFARGLHFLAFMADVDRQFEFVQSSWINNLLFPNGPPPAPDGPPPNNEPPDGPDPIVDEHDPGDQETLQQPSGAHQFAIGPEVVNVTAGEYFFAPSGSALARLGAGAAISTPPVATTWNRWGQPM